MNDKRDFDRIFTAWYEVLFLFALKILKDEETSRDVVNDVFEYLWKNFGRVEKATVKTFLFTITRTRCIDILRKQSHRSEYVDFVQKMTQTYVELDAAEPDGRLQQIQQAMQQLTPRSRMVLEQCYVERKKYKEVADELHVSVAAVHKHIVKALRVIRQNVHSEAHEG